MGKRLYVGNLPYDTDEALLKEAFGQEGRAVATVHVVMDRETGRPRGFAFVEMATEGDAQKALAAMDGAVFCGRNLRVNEAEDRRGPAGGPRPGGGFGGPRPAGPGGPGGPRPPSGPRPDGPPRTGGFSGGGGSSAGSSGGGGGFSGGSGGGGFSRPKPGWSDAPAEPKKYEKQKPQRRRGDEDEDYGGRRGGRRFDDDEEF
jgi:RNA recognition motif-containing protein